MSEVCLRYDPGDYGGNVYRHDSQSHAQSPALLCCDVSIFSSVQCQVWIGLEIIYPGPKSHVS
jgi:hypothetical protein